MQRLTAAHRNEIRAASAAHGGVEVDTQGDALFLAFSTAPGALAAADASQGALAAARHQASAMGVHTGTPLVTEGGYVGLDVHRAARIAAAGHGGQVLVSGCNEAASRRRVRATRPGRAPPQGHDGTSNGSTSSGTSSSHR